VTSSTFFKLRCPKCHETVAVGVTANPDVLRCPDCGVPREPDAEAQSLVPNLDCPSCGISIALAAADTCPMCNEPFSTLQ
jgi:hypothetical protein